MGLLTLFSKPAPKLLRLPAGCFTVDRDGRVLGGTLPSSFPGELVKEIGLTVLAILRDAAAAQLSLSELVINYPSLRISARDLRGGAVIFLSPTAPSTNGTH
jgi:hypothetical protein